MRYKNKTCAFFFFSPPVCVCLWACPRVECHTPTHIPRAACQPRWRKARSVHFSWPRSTRTYPCRTTRLTCRILAFRPFRRGRVRRTPGRVMGRRRWRRTPVLLIEAPRPPSALPPHARCRTGCYLSPLRIYACRWRMCSAQLVTARRSTEVTAGRAMWPRRSWRKRKRKRKRKKRRRRWHRRFSACPRVPLLWWQVRASRAPHRMAGAQ